jgi:16S rRNA (guanine527-N7)-methyltransferase
VSDYASRIADRLEAAGLPVTAAQLDLLAGYLELLAKWSRTINLTSFDLVLPSDGAIDRLIVESAHASQLIDETRLSALDVGSGGGSPSLPLKIFRPALVYTLVESRSRKCAFLREVVRVLGLANVRVEQTRLEEVVRRDSMRHAFGLLTMRAVRADNGLWAAARVLLEPGGRLLWFGARNDDIPSTFDVVSVRPSVTVLEAGSER